MIKIQDIELNYTTTKVFDRLSIEINDGDRYGIIGPEGSGKTTLFYLLLGLLKPDSGTISIDDMEADLDIRRRKKRIGYMPEQFTPYPNMKIMEYMEFFASSYELSGTKIKRRLGMLMEDAGFKGFEEERMDRLSPGNLKKLSLIRALIHDPKILFLDSPLKNTDKQSEKELKEMISRLADSGKTIVVSSEKLQDIEDLCTKAGILEGGRISIEGEPDDLRRILSLKSPIKINVEGNVSKAVNILKKESAVRSISIKNNEMCVYLKEGKIKDSELLKRLVAAGIEISLFARTEPDDEGERTPERRMTWYDAESDFF